MKRILGTAVLFGLFSVRAADIPYYSEMTNEYQRERCQLEIKTSDGATNLPVLIFFHGGGLSGGKKHFPKMNFSNLVVVTAGYRLSPKVTYPVFIQDAAAATTWVLKNIGNYGGDPKRVYISGHSAGGYLAAMVGMDPQWLQANGVSNLELAGIIPISGQMTTHFNVKKMLGDRGPMYRPLITPEAPLYHCASNLPPVCLITGDRKIEWKCRVEENQLLAVSLKTVGCPRVEFHEVPKENHGSIGTAAMPIVRKFIGLDVE